MIYENKNLKLNKILNDEFKLEKEIQTLVEKNLDELLNLKFLKSEYILGDFKFDSIAYNESEKSFVIIEYKRKLNSGIIDQGYAYKNIADDRRDSIVALYNDVFNENKKAKDFNWDQLKIIFISPEFSTYQKAAINEKWPFYLYQINKLQNNLISFVKINNYIYNNSINETWDKNETKSENIYTENNLLNNVDDEIKELYTEIREEILNIGNVNIEPKKFYIAFKSRTNFCDIVIRNKSLDVYLNLKENQLTDKSGIFKLVKEKGHWGNGDYCATIKNDNDVDIDYLISLVKQSYKINS